MADETTMQRQVAYLSVLRRLIRGDVLTTTQLAEALGVQRAAARKWRKALLQLPGASDVKVGASAAVCLDDTEEDENARVYRAVALEFATEALAPMRGTPWHDAILALRDAYQRRIKHMRHVPAEIRRGFAVVPAGKPARDLEQVVRDLSTAWQSRKRCTIHYTGSGGDEASRLLDPIGVLLRGDHLLLVGRYEKLDEQSLEANLVTRFYRVDRIHRVDVHDTRFQRDARFVAQEALATSWGVYATGEAPERVRLRLRGPWAVIVQHFKLHASQQVAEEDADGWREVTFDVCVCPELEQWVLGLIPEVRVVAPESLRETLVGRVRRWLEH